MRALGPDSINNVHFVSGAHNFACRSVHTRKYMEDNSLGSFMLEPVETITEMAKIDRKSWWDNASHSSLEIKTRLKVVQEKFPDPFPIIARHAQIGRTSDQTVLNFPKKAAKGIVANVDVVETSEATATTKRKQPPIDAPIVAGAGNGDSLSRYANAITADILLMQFSGKNNSIDELIFCMAHDNINDYHACSYYDMVLFDREKGVCSYNRRNFVATAHPKCLKNLDIPITNLLAIKSQVNKLKCKALRYVSYMLLSETGNQEKNLLRRAILPCNISSTPMVWPDLELDHIDSHRNLGDHAICNVHLISQPHNGACSEMDTREYMKQNGLGSFFLEPPRCVSEMIHIDSLEWWDGVSQPYQYKSRLKQVQERFPEPFPIIASIYRTRNQARQTVLAFQPHQEPPKEAGEAGEVEETEVYESQADVELQEEVTETEVHGSQADVELQEVELQEEVEETEVYGSQADVELQEEEEVELQAKRVKPKNECAHKLCRVKQTEDSKLCWLHSRCRRSRCKNTALRNINVPIRGAKRCGKGATCPKHVMQNKRTQSLKRKQSSEDRDYMGV